MEFPRRVSCMLLSAMLCVTVTVCAADVPQLMNVQGLLTDSSDEPIADGTHDVTFMIYDTETAGTALWTETRMVTTEGGLFTMVLGEMNSLTESLFESSGLWLGITVAGDSEMTPRQRLTSVPYAMNTRDTSASGNFIPAGVNCEASGSYSAVGGGYNNTASGDLATVAGGGFSDAANGNTAAGSYSFVGGGFDNTAAADWSAVVGGASNEAADRVSLVGGGSNNKAIDYCAVVCGGRHNQAGGQLSFVGGGDKDTASGDNSFVGGGEHNLAGGDYSVVCGGKDNVAGGAYSMAVGHGLESKSYASTAVGQYNVDWGMSDGWWTSDPIFMVGNGTDESNRSNALTVWKNGYMGIGTAYPTDMLHIQNDDAANIAIRLRTINEGESSLKLFESNNYGFEFLYDGLPDKLYLWSRKYTGNEAIRMTWLKNGSVGIGTTDPGADLLDVRGRAYASGGWQTTDADYAEWFEKESDAQPGDIIGINLQTGRARIYQPGDRFIGICSASPAVTGNRSLETDEEMAETHILVGLLGQLDFNEHQVIRNGGIVETIDGQEVGILLSNGKALVGR